MYELAIYYLDQISKVMLYKDSFKTNEYNKFAKLEQLNSMLKSRERVHENSRLTLQIDNSKSNNAETVASNVQNSYFPKIINKASKHNFENDGKCCKLMNRRSNPKDYIYKCWFGHRWNWKRNYFSRATQQNAN